MEQVKSFLEISKLVRKQIHRNLTVFPMLAPDRIELKYLNPFQLDDKDSVSFIEIIQEILLQ